MRLTRNVFAYFAYTSPVADQGASALEENKEDYVLHRGIRYEVVSAEEFPRVPKRSSENSSFRKSNKGIDVLSPCII